jgi:hypothetical protein
VGRWISGRQTWNRDGHLVPGGEDIARERLDAFLTPPRTNPTVAHAVAHAPQNDETPESTGVVKYRYRDSNPVADRCDQWESSVYRRSKGSRKGSTAKIGPRLVRGAKASSISSASRSPGM